MKRTTLTFIALSLFTLVTFTACGGGGDPRLAGMSDSDIANYHKLSQSLENTKFELAQYPKCSKEYQSVDEMAEAFEREPDLPHLRLWAMLEATSENLKSCENKRKQANK